MKMTAQRFVIFCTLSAVLALGVQHAIAQPTTLPAKKAPVTKKAESKATAPTPKEEPKKPETKTEGKVEIVAEKVKVTETKEDEGKGYGGVIANHAIKLGFTLLSLLLSGLVFVLLKKFGFEAQNAKIQDVLMKGSAYAEQWSLKKAKLDGTTKPGGPEKREEAISIAMAMAREYKLPEKGKDWWEERLESWLGVKNGAPKADG